MLLIDTLLIGIIAISVSQEKTAIAPEAEFIPVTLGDESQAND